MNKTKSELHRTWADTIDMTDSYNKKHNANVDINNCVKIEGLFIDDTPLFNNHPELYTFAKGILFNEEHNEHIPVFVGDKLYHIRGRNMVVITNGHLNSAINATNFSWQAPKKKETFVLTTGKNDVCTTRNNYVPCPSSNWTPHVLYLTKNNIGDMFYFDSNEELEEAHKALFTILATNRQKGN